MGPNDRALIHANISQAKRKAEIEAIKAKMHHISKENVRLKALVRTQKKSSKPMKNKSGSNKSLVKPSPLHMPHEQNTPVIKGDSAAVTQDATERVSNRATAMSANALVRVTLDTPHGQAPSVSHGESETQVAVDDEARELWTEDKVFEFPGGSARDQLIPVPAEVIEQFGPEEEGAEYEIWVLPSGEFIRKRV